jgi:hypothetical protein
MAVRVELLHLPGCPHLDTARQLLVDCLDDVGLPRSAIEERSGAFPSPSILVDGIDVMGTPQVMSASCRLDVPTRERVLAALRPLAPSATSSAL